MSPHILVTDDSESIRELMCMTLRSAGYSVVPAEDGVKALAEVNQEDFDLLISDLHMPNMDGIELTRQVRKGSRNRLMPILLLTTETQSHMIEKAREAGATGWLVKPFNEDKLLSIIQKLAK